MISAASSLSFRESYSFVESIWVGYSRFNCDGANPPDFCSNPWCYIDTDLCPKMLGSQKSPIQFFLRLGMRDGVESVRVSGSFRRQKIVSNCVDSYSLEVQDQTKWLVFRMIHVKDSRSYQWAKFSLWTSWVLPFQNNPLLGDSSRDLFIPKRCFWSRFDH